MRSRFTFPLVFDPLRIVLGLVRSLFGIVLVSLLCGGVMLAAALYFVDSRYVVSAQLLGENPYRPESGDGLKSPYLPILMQDETLIFGAKSSEVLKDTSEKLGGAISPQELWTMTEMAKIEDSDLFELTVTRPGNPGAAVELATAWAEAVMEYTAEVRRRDAEAKIAAYQKQLTENKEKTAALDRTLSESGQSQNILGEDTQATALQATIQALEKELADARVQLAAKANQISVYDNQAKGTGMLRSMLTLRQQELQKLRRTYTESHPEVQGAVEDVQLLTQLLAKAERGEDYDLRGLNKIPDLPSEGEFQAQVLRLKEEKAALDEKVTVYTDELAAKKQEMAALRGQSLSLSELRSNLNEAMLTTNLLSARIKEAEFVRDTPPSQLSLFQPASLADVEEESGLLKKAAAVCVGLLGGAGLMILRVLVRELRSARLSTPVQTALATGLYPRHRYPEKREAESRAAVRELWLTSMATDLSRRRRFFFVLVGEVPGEQPFWWDLLKVINEDGCRIVFVDFDQQPMPLSLNGYTIPMYNHSQPSPVSVIHPFAEPNLLQTLQAIPRDSVVIGRWGMPPVAWLGQVRVFFESVFLVVSAQAGNRTEVEKNSRVYRQLLGDPEETILVEEKAPGFWLRTVQNLEDTFFDKEDEDDSDPDRMPSYEPRRMLPNHQQPTDVT